MTFDSAFRTVVDEPDPSRQSPPSPRHPNAPLHCLSPATARTATRSPYAKAMTCAGVVYLVTTAVLIAAVLSPVLPQATSHETGDAIAGVMAFLFVPALVPGLVTGTIVSLSRRCWPVWRIVLLFLPLFAVTVVLQVMATVW